MKTLVAVCFMLLVLPTMVTCDSDGENSHCPELLIEAVFPFAASANDPVLIKGTGFNRENITVRFGSLATTIIESNNNYVSTKVPSGLLGLVELSVTNGIGCIGIKPFEVSSQAQSGIPGSPPVYFISPGGFSFAVNLPSVEFVTLKNFYDESHETKIFPFREVSTFEGDEKWASGTFLFLQSTVTGRQFIFESITY